MKKIYILLSVIGILFLLGFTLWTLTAERGYISIISPSQYAVKSHADNPPAVPLSILSTFGESKTADVYVNGKQLLFVSGEPYQCLLSPNTTTNCGLIPITSTGINKIVVEVNKRDGSAITAETTFEWAPYSQLDKTLLSVTGTNSLSQSYLVLALFLIPITTIVTMLLGAKITQGDPKGVKNGGVIGFFASIMLVALAVFTPEDPTTTVMVIFLVTTIVIVGILATSWQGHKYARVDVTDLNENVRISFLGSANDGDSGPALGALRAGETYSKQIVDNQRAKIGLPVKKAQFLETINEDE